MQFAAKIMMVAVISFMGSAISVGLCHFAGGAMTITQAIGIGLMVAWGLIWFVASMCWLSEKAGL